MTRRVPGAGLALLLLATPATGALAQTPTAKQLTDRFIDALGGRDAIQSATARHVWGHVEVPSQGLKGPIEVLTAAPNRILTHSTIPGLGDSYSGYDGTTGWTDNPAMGAMLLDGKALNQLQQQSDFYGILHPERYISSAEVVGDTTFEGKACWQLKLTTKWGEEYSEYFDKETGLLHGTQRSQETPMGAIPATTIVSDYKVVGGLKAPMLITVKVMSIEQIVRVDSISAAPIPDSVFALPAKIKALKTGS